MFSLESITGTTTDVFVLDLGSSTSSVSVVATATDRADVVFSVGVILLFLSSDVFTFTEGVAFGFVLESGSFSLLTLDPCTSTEGAESVL
ncbi:hypothetical protein [Lacticaseibacillus manihotivorans]|uniref:hypothetical protein n=1 Tax=Lacticaseibacillus manihotivorans TaxID=88233 RepID=UPI001FB25678|nr:hypothetical protein [Lacticaseibacillus manihotivorans]